MYIPLMFLLAIPCLAIAKLIEPARRNTSLKTASVMLVIALMWSSEATAYCWRSERSLFQRSITMCPENNFVAHNALGVWSLQTGDFTAATNHFFQAIAIAPKSNLAHYNLALAFTRLGEKAEAEEEYKSALSCDPDDIPTLVAYGHLLLSHVADATNSLNEAISLGQRAVHLDRRSLAAYDLLVQG